MNEELNILFEVISRLDTAEIAYMVTGSMALAVYARPRMTRDIDIIVQVTVDDADRIITLFQEDFYLDTDTVKNEILRHGKFNIIHHAMALKINFIVRKEDEYRREEFARRIEVSIQGRRLWIVAPEDLILSKLIWAQASESELQLRDVQQLLAIDTPLDTEYLAFWAARLGVMTLLEKAKSHA